MSYNASLSSPVFLKWIFLNYLKFVSLSQLLCPISLGTCLSVLPGVETLCIICFRSGTDSLNVPSCVYSGTKSKGKQVCWGLVGYAARPFQSSKLAGRWQHMKIHTHVHTKASSPNPVAKGPNCLFLSCVSLLPWWCQIYNTGKLTHL